VSRLEPIGASQKLDLELIDLARLDERRLRVRLAVRYIEVPLGHERRGAVRGDIAELDHEHRDVRGRGDVEDGTGKARDLDIFLERLGRVGQGERLVLALVQRHGPGRREGPSAVHPCGRSYRGGPVLVHIPVFALVGPVLQSLAWAQVHRRLRCARRRPFALGSEDSLVFHDDGGRFHVFAAVDIGREPT